MRGHVRVENHLDHQRTKLPEVGLGHVVENVEIIISHNSRTKSTCSVVYVTR